MKSLFFRLILLLSLIQIPLYSFAKSLTSAINSIDVSKNKKWPHLIKLETGDVVFVSFEDLSSLQVLEDSLKKKETIQIEVDEKNNFQSLKFLPEGSFNVIESFPKEERNLNTLEELPFTPTIVSNSFEATKIFRRMRRDYQYYSQCYNRAHVWAYEEFLKTGLKSKKYFLFFTKRYIRKYRYKWWFHVSPSVAVKGLGDRIIDRRYTSGHRSINNWTDIFIYSDKTCPIVSKYNDYFLHQLSEDCYLIPVSMYFWQPRDIQRRDLYGTEKSSFIKSEIDYSYKEAF